MALFEKKISGAVILPPHQEQTQARQLDYGSRNVPTWLFRLKKDDGSICTVTFRGELEGQIAQGDVLVVKGFGGRSGSFRATEIWLRGHQEIQGDSLVVAPVDPPVRLARKTVCAIATCLFGCDSPEVTTLLAIRDKRLEPHAVGRLAIKVYYAVSPWFTICLLERSPFLQDTFRRILQMIVKAFSKRTGEE